MFNDSAISKEALKVIQDNTTQVKEIQAKGALQAISIVIPDHLNGFHIEIELSDHTDNEK